jgi:hypothetical protein
MLQNLYGLNCIQFSYSPQKDNMLIKAKLGQDECSSNNQYSPLPVIYFAKNCKLCRNHIKLSQEREIWNSPNHWNHYVNPHKSADIPKPLQNCLWMSQDEPQITCILINKTFKSFNNFSIKNPPRKHTRTLSELLEQICVHPLPPLPPP